jgi:hypothetical protein
VEHFSSKHRLINQLRKEYLTVKENFKKILQASYGAMANFLGAESSSTFISSVSRYTETRTVSSKINAVLTSLMLDYVNTLIHHLLKAGKNITTDKNKGNRNINLVSFRVSDLLRSKLQCSESSFISLLNTMYLLDSNEQMRGLFKLVRIKNKLDDPASNIMINYLFMGKIQCELQLSIQEAKGKEKHYYTMSHFVYELVRGKFGSIAECAIMVSQLDPMIAACKQPYYQEKEAPFNLVLAGEKKMDVSISTKQTRFFECVSCGKLITNEQTDKLLRLDKQKICYRCIFKDGQEDEFLKEELREAFKQAKDYRIKNYGELQDLNRDKYLVTLSASGEVTFHLVVHIFKEFKTFVVRLDNQLLKQSECFEFQDYTDITKRIKKDSVRPNGISTISFLFDQSSVIP